MALVRNVLTVFNTMTIRTKNYKIFQSIIFAIFIYMMNSQNFWMGMVPAFFATFDHSFCFKTSPYRAIRGIPFSVVFFMFAFLRAIHSFRTPVVVKKLFSTMATVKRGLRFNPRFPVTKGRTIFLRVLPAMQFKNIFANWTNICNFRNFHGVNYGTL
jgi:hypothetical protein